MNNVQVARGIAALSVVIAHALGQFVNHPIPNMRVINSPVGSVWGNGVDVFFVVSGFIMYYMTYKRFNRSGYPLEFLRRRLLRVAPLYYVFTSLMLTMALLVPSAVNNGLVGVRYVLSSYLFIPAVRPDGHYQPLFALGWTLNYEFFFYVSFAIALIAPASRGLLALIVFFVLLAILHPLMPQGPLYFWSEPIILEFIAGIGIAALFIRGVRLNLPASLVLLMGALVLTVVFHRTIPNADRLIHSGVPSIILCAALILLPDRQWPSSVVAVGNASFSLYLSHPFSLNAITAFWRKFQLPLDGYSYLLALVLGSMIGGALVFRWLETPLVTYLQRRFEVPRRAVPV